MTVRDFLWYHTSSNARIYFANLPNTISFDGKSGDLFRNNENDMINYNHENPILDYKFDTVCADGDKLRIQVDY